METLLGPSKPVVAPTLIPLIAFVEDENYFKSLQAQCAQIASVSKRSSEFMLLRTDERMLDHRDPTQTVNLSGQAFVDYCQARLDYFVSVFPDIMDRICPLMSDADRALMLDGAQTIMKELSGQGTGVKIGFKATNTGPSGTIDGRNVVVQEKYGSTTAIFLDMILMHEMFHIVQWTFNQNLQGLFETTATLFADKAIGFIYDNIPKSDTADGYKSVYSTYVIDRSVNNRLMSEAMFGFRSEHMVGLIKSSASNLEIPENLINNIYSYDGMSVPVEDKRIPSNNFRLALRLSPAINSEYQNAFDQEIKTQKSEVYLPVPGFLDQLNHELSQMDQAGPSQHELATMWRVWWANLLDANSNMDNFFQSPLGFIQTNDSGLALTKGMLQHWTSEFTDGSCKQVLDSLDNILDSIYFSKISFDQIADFGNKMERKSVSGFEVFPSSLAEIMANPTLMDLPIHIDLVRDDFGPDVTYSLDMSGNFMKANLALIPRTDISLKSRYEMEGNQQNFNDWIKDYSYRRMDELLREFPMLLYYLEPPDARNFVDIETRLGAIRSFTDPLTATQKLRFEKMDRPPGPLDPILLSPYNLSDRIIDLPITEKTIEMSSAQWDVYLLKGLFAAVGDASGSYYEGNESGREFPNLFALFAHRSIRVIYSEIAPAAKTDEIPTLLAWWRASLLPGLDEYLPVFLDFCGGNQYAASSIRSICGDEIGTSDKIDLRDPSDRLLSPSLAARMSARLEYPVISDEICGTFEKDCPLLRVSDYIFPSGYFGSYENILSKNKEKPWMGMANAFVSWTLFTGISSMNDVDVASSDYGPDESLAMNVYPLVIRYLRSQNDLDAGSMADWMESFFSQYVWPGSNRFRFADILDPLLDLSIRNVVLEKSSDGRLPFSDFHSFDQDQVEMELSNGQKIRLNADRVLWTDQSTDEQKANLTIMQKDGYAQGAFFDKDGGRARAMIYDSVGRQVKASMYYNYGLISPDGEIALQPGWNDVAFDMSALTNGAYRMVIVQDGGIFRQAGFVVAR